MLYGSSDALHNRDHPAMVGTKTLLYFYSLLLFVSETLISQHASKVDDDVIQEV